MTPPRAAQMIAAILGGLAVSAAILGSPRLGIVVLALTSLIHSASLEALRTLADRQEKRP